MMKRSQSPADIEKLIEKIRADLVLDETSREGAFRALSDEIAISTGDLSEEDTSAFSYLAERAIQGIDIELEHPDLFKELKANRAAQEVFLETLVFLNYDFEGSAEANSDASVPKLLLSLRIAADTINAMVSPRSMDPVGAFREDALGVEPVHFYSEQSIAQGITFSVNMSLQLSAREKDALDVEISILAKRQEQTETKKFQFEAHMKWGTFEQRLPFNEGFTNEQFAPIPLSAIHDQGKLSDPLLLEISVM